MMAIRDSGDIVAVIVVLLQKKKNVAKLWIFFFPLKNNLLNLKIWRLLMKW